ncbi:MAG: succinate dehydrogenase cytochrome b subunit [Verrucomicrobiota bacterium]|jgi:succinate dehydrogenase / fumarate reductase cytochrome b subunit
MRHFLRNLFCFSVGKKYLMAGTGAVMVLFVIGHMAGNLQFFLGPEAINRYGHFLQSNVEVLWPVRLALLAVIALHIWSATSLTLENRAARPAAYEQWQPTAASYASRTMMMSGIIVAVFIVYHLLHYTVMVQAVNFAGRDFHTLTDSEHRHDIYRMMVIGFQQPAVSLFYIIGVFLLCLHLSHGMSAMFQSLGWKNQGYGPCLDRAAKWAAALIFLGYVSIPISILLRWVQ